MVKSTNWSPFNDDIFMSEIYYYYQKPIVPHPEANMVDMNEDNYHQRSGPLGPAVIPGMISENTVVALSTEVIQRNEWLPLEGNYTILELENFLGVTKGPDGRRHLPFSKTQATNSLIVDGPEVFNKKEIIVENLQNEWRDLKEVDCSVADEYKRVSKHSERVAYNVFRTFLIYQLANDLRTNPNLWRELRMETSNAPIDLYTLEHAKFTPEQYRIAIRASLAAVFHDIGKAQITQDEKTGIYYYKQQETLVSTEKYTEKQRVTMIDHREDGANKLGDAGMPEYYCQTALNHHNDDDKFQRQPNAAYDETLLSPVFVAGVTRIMDGLDAATTNRPYSSRKPFDEMYYDSRILSQLFCSNDSLLSRTYAQFIDIAREEEFRVWGMKPEHEFNNDLEEMSQEEFNRLTSGINLDILEEDELSFMGLSTNAM